ncbi:hypothetical protein HY486_02165 [Candidatus Woesearchaeota archaeon]|nr:hypothetical protein [Candidatus Woesearchaeota archaeon]
MGLLDALKKKEIPLPPSPPLPPPPPPSLASPVQLVLQLEQEGKSDPEIIAELTRQGFDQTQVYDAIVQARQKGIEPSNSQQQATQSAMVDQKNIQETVEKVVDEKWSAFQKELQKLSEWKESVEIKNTEITTKIQDMRADLESLHKAIVGKIGEYDRSLLDVGVEMKAMEQVFKKVLPELSANVQELSKITKKAKSSKEK